MTDNEERAALCRRLREHGVTIVSTLCADIEIEKLQRWAADVAVPGESAAEEPTVRGRLSDIIWGATEAAHIATEADKWGNASRALAVVRAAQSALRATVPEDENPFAYDANGPQHTTARVPRGMTREAFEPLLIAWTATLDRRADPATMAAEPDDCSCSLDDATMPRGLHAADCQISKGAKDVEPAVLIGEIDSWHRRTAARHKSAQASPPPSDG